MENKKKFDFKLLLKRLLVILVLFSLFILIFYSMGSCIIAHASADPFDSSSSIGFYSFWYYLRTTDYYTEGSDIFFTPHHVEFYDSTVSILCLTSSATVVLPDYTSLSHVGEFNISLYSYSIDEIIAICYLVPSTVVDSTNEDGHWDVLFQNNTILDDLLNSVTNPTYQGGYQVGYEQGLLDGFNEGYSAAESALSVSIDARIESARAEGIAQGEAAAISREHIGIKYIWAIASVPVSTLASILNWDFLGINLFGLVTGLFTILIVFWVVKKVI